MNFKELPETLMMIGAILFILGGFGSFLSVVDNEDDFRTFSRMFGIGSFLLLIGAAGHFLHLFS